MYWDTNLATTVAVVRYDDTSGGYIVWEGDNPVIFTADTWDVYTTSNFVYAAPGASVGSYAEFGFVVNGERNSGRMRVMVGRAPPSGDEAGEDFGAVKLYASRVMIDSPGTRIQVPMKLADAPQPFVVLGAPDRVDLTPVMDRDSSFAALSRRVRAVIQRNQSRPPPWNDQGEAIWWIDAEVDFDAEYASDDGGLFSVGDPGYRVIGTNLVEGLEFTNAVLWGVLAANTTVTPALFTMNSVVVPADAGVLVFTNDVFGWAPGEDGVEVVDAESYTNVFLPHVLSMPGYSLVAQTGREAALGTRVGVSEFPWFCGWWCDQFGINVLWALRDFDYVLDGTNPVESILYDRVELKGDDIIPIAGAMSRSMAVVPLRCLSFGGASATTGLGHVSFSLTNAEPTLVATREWWAYNEWLTGASPYSTNTYSMNVVTGGVDYPLGVISLLSVNALWGETGWDAFSIEDSGTLYCWREYTEEAPDGVWASSNFPSYSSSTPSEGACGHYMHKVRTTCITDAFIDYPSEFAILQGLVARVRVYAVFEVLRKYAVAYEPEPYATYDVTNEACDVVEPPLDYPDPEELMGLVSGETGYHEWSEHIAANSGYSFSSTDTLAKVGAVAANEVILSDYWPPHDSMALDESARRLDRFTTTNAPGGQARSRAFKTLRLTKIADVEAPTGYPIRVSVGVPGPETESLAEFTDFDFSCVRTIEYLESGLKASWGAESSVFPEGSDYHTEFLLDYDRSQKTPYEDSNLGRVMYMLEDVVVVVDWNFDHMGTTPYEPTPYTPEWLSTNAP